MAQFGFEAKPRRAIPANDDNRQMSSSVRGATRPALVTLESGIQALIEIVGFTHVDGVPVAIAGGLAEDVDPADWVERGPNGIRLKRMLTPVQSGPVNVEHSL